MTDNPSHLPPQNLEAEEAALGCFMLKPATLDLAEQQDLRADDFYRDAHRVIYEVVRFLHERDELDELAVVSELKARRKLTAAGGSAYVMALSDRAAGLTSQAARHIDDVIDAAKLRSMVATGHEIARLGYEHPDKIGKLVDRCVNMVESMARNAHRSNGDIEDAASLAEWAVQHIISTEVEDESWPYPLPELQGATGGMRRGQLVSIGALPGVGKSVFKNQILLGLPKHVRVGIVNLEMEARDEQVRLLSALTGIDGRLITRRMLSTEQQMQVVDAADELSTYSYEFHSGAKGIEALRALQRKHKYDVLMLDHFHRLEGVEEYQALVRSSRVLKSIALETKCVIVNLFQLNNSSNRADPGETPTITRVKGGPALLEDSDVLMFLHRTFNEFGYPTNNAQLIYAKNRHGESGTATKLRFDAASCSFAEAAA